jgi:hypothetical protein
MSSSPVTSLTLTAAIITLTSLILSVVAIPILWRRPRVKPPRGLSTSSLNDDNIGQLLFFPLIIFNFIGYCVGYILQFIMYLSSNGLTWLVPLFLIFVSLINMLVYWPIHMCLADTQTYLSRIIGVVLISLQITTSLLSMIINDDIAPAKIVTFYTPFCLYSVLSISYLLVPKLWSRPINFMIKSNIKAKLFLSIHLTAVSLLITMGGLIQLAINVNVVLAIVNVVVGLFTSMFGINENLYNIMTEVNRAILVVGVVIPIIIYLTVIIGNCLYYKLYSLNNIVVNDCDLIDYYEAYFKFVGVFVGKQIIIFAFVCLLLWIGIIVIYSLSLVGKLWFVCERAIITFLPAYITVRVVDEIFRTIIGVWLYGSRYRPWPRKLLYDLLQYVVKY